MNFFNWLITSSADPEKLSATIAGIAAMLVAYAATYIPLLCTIHLVCLDPGVFGDIVNVIAQLLEGGVAIVGLVVALFGLIRKVRLGRWSAA